MRNGSNYTRPCSHTPAPTCSEGDKVTHHVDISWNENWTERASTVLQTRRNTLTITTPPFKRPQDGREVRSTLAWEKVKAPAAVAGENPVLGTWKLKSQVRVVTATGEKFDQMGEHPKGNLSYSADGRMFAIVTSDNRIKPLTANPTNEQRVKLHQTLFAYAGTCSNYRRQTVAEQLTRIGRRRVDHPLGCDDAAPSLEARSAA